MMGLILVVAFIVYTFISLIILLETSGSRRGREVNSADVAWCFSWPAILLINIAKLPFLPFAEEARERKHLKALERRLEYRRKVRQLEDELDREARRIK
jgi:hypothetical protein